MYLKHCDDVRIVPSEQTGFTYLKTLVELGLLLVNYTKTEVNFVCFLEIGLDLHDLGEGLLGVVVAAISVVQDTDSVPKHRVLRCG